MRYSLLIVALLTTSHLFAQVSQSVEVTREYVPTLEVATKPSLKAEVVDTTTIRPEVDYSIAPLSISTSFNTRPIEPAEVTYWQFNKDDNFAIKAGVGYPLSSLFDGYYSRYNAGLGYLSASVNHRGNYLDMANPFGGESCANQVNSSAAVAGGIHFGVRTLDTKIGYSNNIYHRSAAVMASKSLSKIVYQDANFALSFGDSFIDLSRWNFSLGFEADHFWNGEEGDNTVLNSDFKLARSFVDVGTISLGAGYDYIMANEGSANHNFGVVDVDFSYRYSMVKFGLLAGVLYKGAANQYIDSDGVEQNTMLLTPQGELYYLASSRSKIFARYDGDISLGNYASMAQINPYISNSGIASMRSTIYYNLQLGAEGALLSRNQLSYKIYGEWSRANDDRLWLLIVDSADNYNYMAIDYIDQSTLSLNLDVDYRPIPQLGFGFDSHLYYYEKETNENGYAIGRANFDCTFSVYYTHSKFNIGASAKTVTARDVSYIYYNTTEQNRLAATVDLGVDFNYNIAPAATLFLEANNLINQTIYELYGYQELGINFMVGVKLRF